MLKIWVWLGTPAGGAYGTVNGALALRVAPADVQVTVCVPTPFVVVLVRV